MIEADEFYHHIFKLYDSEKRVLLTDVMEIHTLELRKLPEASGTDEREDELLNWLRLIRSEGEEEIDMIEAKTHEMDMAVVRLKKLSADERTRMLYEARELYLMDEMVRLEDAEARGEARGKLEGKLEMAKNLLAEEFPPEVIAKSSGLSLDEVRALADL